MFTNTVRSAIVTSLACGALLVAGASEAGPITLKTFANAAISPGYYDEDSLSGSLNPFTDLQIASNAAGTFIFGNLTSSLDVSASAFVRVVSGSLSMGAETKSSTNTSTGAGGQTTSSQGIASAGLNVSDSLTVVGGPDSGNLALNFAISGSLSTATSGYTTFSNVASASGTFAVNSIPLELQAYSKNSPVEDTGPVFLTFPLSWTVLVPYSGSSATMDLRLGSTAITQDPACGSVCTELAWGALGNTFTLGSIQVLDQSGQVVSDAFAVGGSGITYNNLAQPTAVPDSASTMALFGLALGSVEIVRRRRSRSAFEG